MNLKSYVISVNSDDVYQDFNHDYKSNKYKLRREFIKDNLFKTLLDKIDIDFFDSITPDKFLIEGDFLIYNDEYYKRGIDWNYKNYPLIYANSLTLTTLLLYKKSLNEERDLLIFEDDAFIPNENLDNILSSIESFSQIKEPAILYLQSECPWRKNYPIKTYGNSLYEYNQHLLKIKNNWYDMSGTTSYLINKCGMIEMIKLINEVGLSNIDQLITIAMKEMRLNIYLPKNHKNMVLINKELQ
jgi:hypothetical protein